MTRFLLLLSLLASTAFGQTYVRPSKGAVLNPWATRPSADWADWPRLSTDGGVFAVNAYGPVWDWSAFESMRIRVVGTTLGQENYLGESCYFLYLVYNVTDIANFVRLNLLKSTSGNFAQLMVLDSTSPGSRFQLLNSTNGNVDLSRFIDCDIQITVTPIPFAPTAVYPASFTPTDGGSSTYSISVSTPTNDAGMPISAPYCNVSRSSASSVGTSVVAIPADGGLPGRWLLRACNSAKNAGTPIVTCSVNTVPDGGTLADGEALEVGDCAAWASPEPVYCLSDTAATVVSTYECR